MYLIKFLPNFAEFRGVTWISWLRDCAKYQKPRHVITNKEDISLQDGPLVQVLSEYQYYTRDSKQ